MAEQTTFVKIDRNILQWRWITDSKTFHVFMLLILKANIEDHDFRRITVHRGELVTSLPHLARDTGLSIQEVRTALNHLKLTGEITDTPIPFGRLICIVNYALYQARPTGKATDKQQAINRQATGKQHQSKNSKKDKNEKNEKNVLSTPQPSDAVAYFAEHGRSEADAMKFFRYNQARGWKINKTPIDDWKAAADIWFDEAPDVGGGSDSTELDAFGKPIQKEFV